MTIQVRGKYIGAPIAISDIYYNWKYLVFEKTDEGNLKLVREMLGRPNVEGTLSIEVVSKLYAREPVLPSELVQTGICSIQPIETAFLQFSFGLSLQDCELTTVLVRDVMEVLSIFVSKGSIKR